MRREQLKLVHPGDGGADCEPKVIDTVDTPTSNLVWKSRSCKSTALF